jgi:signal transduction histidine kinase
LSVHRTNVIELSEPIRPRNFGEAEGSAKSGAAERLAHASDTDFPLVITAMPIDATQRRVAISVIIVVAFIELASAPFASLPVARIDSFIPVLQSVMCILHLITAVLLFSQYSVRPRFATLAIACGYVSSGLFAFDQSLAFPGAYSTGILIGDANTVVWLFVIWHTAFPSAMMIYALTKDAENNSPSPRSPMVVIIISIACVVAAVGGLTWLVVINSAYLPKVFLAGGKMDSTTTIYLAVYLWVLNSTALVLLFFRRRTILDLWLMVSLFAWWPLFLVPMHFTVVPFSVGWYVARSLAVLASSALLVVLMGETTLLYARLTSSIGMLRRERGERLATVEAATSAMAHEIRQPLSGIANMGAAALNWLQTRPSNIERASACVKAMIDANNHAEEIIGGIGGLFRRVPSERTMSQLNDACREVVKLVHHDVIVNEICVRVRYQEDLPLISADHAQMQQVILNLVRNAIDAMSGRPAGERRLWLWTGFDTKSIRLRVRDTGSGVSDKDREHIFDPFYTTKSNGMGLGLAICRKIIEEHGGTLHLARTNTHGSMFEIVFRLAGPSRVGGRPSSSRAN